MPPDPIAKIIKNHLLYRMNKGGMRGNLSSRKLTGLSLAGFDLKSIIAPGAHFGGCNLSDTDLRV